MLYPKTACADNSFAAYRRALVWWDEHTHRILHKKSISKWKIPPTYTLMEPAHVLWDLLSFFPHQTVYFPLLGHGWTRQLLPKLWVAKLKPFHPVLNIFRLADFTGMEPNISQRGVQNSTFFIPGSYCRQWITKWGNVNRNKMNESVVFSATAAAIWTIKICCLHRLSAKSESQVWVFTGYKSN